MAPWRPYIIGTNLLTKFCEHPTIYYVAATVLTRQLFMTHNGRQKIDKRLEINVASREKCPAPGGHVFKATKTIFELIQDIIGTNLLTKFHDDRKINVTSRVLTSGGHVFQPTGIIFELVQDIIGMNLLTQFHEDRTINVASRIRKNAPPLGGHVFQANEKCLTPGGHVLKITGIIFELVQDIIGMNLLIKFHEDWTINVASRVLTRFYYSHIRKNAPPLGSHVFQAKVTIIELIQDISGTNLLSKFHEDWKINVASRVLTRKNAPPPGGHVFQPTGIIFELIQDIIGMNLLTKFYEDQTKMWPLEKNAPPLGSHVFQANVTIFELIQDIIETNLLTKFHEY
ncbi:hypothetical protein DPMN_041341 [Dreissena polymorpha]|uniref:Uncharacterized protein n=1 Tax=Dreissena polymorpha TaxID=45954 RepID=A0A9D4HTU7_DREPO|nr:hypothetical protein DPMN_041341 [Dreissena polymorpha]